MTEYTINDRAFCIVNVYADGPYSKMVFKCRLQEGVHPFIITQHIFKAIDKSMDIGFDDLYNAVKRTYKEDNLQLTIDDRYNTYIVSGYDAFGHEVDCGREYQTLEIWNDSLYPFNVFYVNACNLILDETDIFSNKLSLRKVQDYIIQEESFKSGKQLEFSKHARDIRNYINEKYDCFPDHFKYNDYVICRKSITRLDQLEDIGYKL